MFSRDLRHHIDPYDRSREGHTYPLPQSALRLRDSNISPDTLRYVPPVTHADSPHQRIKKGYASPTTFFGYYTQPQPPVASHSILLLRILFNFGNLKYDIFVGTLNGKSGSSV